MAVFIYLFGFLLIIMINVKLVVDREVFSYALYLEVILGNWILGIQECL